MEQHPGQRDAADHAERRQHHALDEQLPHQPPPARADREAQTDLPPPGRGPDEQEPGHVRATDQQHQSEQDGQTDGARAQGLLDQRVGRHVAGGDDGYADAVVRFGIRRLERAHHPVQVFGRAAGGFSRPESSLHQHPAQPAALESGGAGRGRPVVHHHGLDVVDPRHRRPESGREDRRRHAGETLRRHADDGVRAAADVQHPSQDAGVAVEGLGPERRRDHDDRLGAGKVVFRRQRAPVHHGRPDDLEVGARHRLARQHPGSFSDADRSHRGNVAGDAGQGPGVTTQVHVIGIRTPLPGEAVEVARVDVDKLFLPVDGKPPQQRGVQQREERRVEADPDGERDRGGGRQPRVFPKQPTSVVEVLAESVDLPNAPTSAAVFLDDVQLAELDASLPPRLPTRQAAGFVPLDGALEMKVQLLVQIVLGGAPAEQRAKTEAEIVDHPGVIRRPARGRPPS